MWSYFLGGMDDSKGLAVQGLAAENAAYNAETARAAQEAQENYQRSNVELQNRDMDFKERAYNDTLVDFGSMEKSGYSGPMKDVIHMFQEGRGGQISPAGLLNPWIQPEYYSEMQRSGEKLTREILSEQAKTAARQMEAQGALARALSSLRPLEGGMSVPVEATPEMYDAVKQSSTGILGGYPAMGGLAIASTLGLLRADTPTVNPNEVPDSAGITPAQRVAEAGMANYGQVHQLMQGGYLPNELNLNLAYQSGQTVNSPQVSSKLGMAEGIMQARNALALLGQSMTPESQQKLNAILMKIEEGMKADLALQEKKNEGKK